jgi:hypothetical protein
LLEAETNKYCPGGYDIGAISNLITWVLNFFLSVHPFLRSVLATQISNKISKSQYPIVNISLSAPGSEIYW